MINKKIKLTNTYYFLYSYICHDITHSILLFLQSFDFLILTRLYGRIDENLLFGFSPIPEYWISHNERNFHLYIRKFYEKNRIYDSMLGGFAQKFEKSSAILDL